MAKPVRGVNESTAYLCDQCGTRYPTETEANECPNRRPKFHAMIKSAKERSDAAVARLRAEESCPDCGYPRIKGDPEDNLHSIHVARG